jgi:GH25 family lysozyme M1 (1,4-beta-N-acetylmuramidase)
VIAKISSNHMTVCLSFNLDIDDDGNLLDCIEKSISPCFSDAMQDFLNLCQGKYFVDVITHSITFENNQDFMQYSLCIQDNEDSIWVK